MALFKTPVTVSTAAVDDEDSEAAPLIVRDDDVAPQRTKSNPLPRAQLAIIYGIKLVVPVASTQALPYVNKMIAAMDLPSGRSVGYYTGLLATAATAGQFMTIFFWGGISDRIGRTPVIGIGMAGLAIGTVLFGASTTFTMALVTRFIKGAFSGFIGVIHSVVGELSDKTNQSTAFPYYDIISALGFVIGPLIGGTFAEPATEYPNWFNTPFFRKYPYILPCIIAGAFAFIAAIVSITWLRETLPKKSGSSTPIEVTAAYDPAAPATQLESGQIVEKPLGLRALLDIPALRAICVSQWMLGFIAAAFNSVFVLMAYTEIEDGGMSMNPRKIASALSIMGFVSIFLKASLPIFLRRFDALNVFRFTLQTWPITFALMPLLNVLARHAANHPSNEAQVLLWLMISFVLFMSRLGSLAFSIVMILTKDHTPPSIGLGMANSVSELSQMVGIAVGAPFISSLFAFSVTHKLLSGYFWVPIICFLSLVGDYSASRIAKHRFS